PRFREAQCDFFRQSLDPRPAGHETMRLAAIRAERGQRLGMAAMMTLQLAEQAMLDQPRRAIGTFEAMTAGAAERQRRIAPAIEEEHRLLAGFQCLAEGLYQRRREEALPLRLVAPHIDEANFGELRHTETRRQMQAAVAALLDI